jgi:DNA-binding transcriptional regulator YbjK
MSQPHPQTPVETDRKTLIADAAIALLGSAGAKGLTHRAVDAQAELPEGSTSFYCRTRSDLLALTLKRHAWIDLQDLHADAQHMTKDGFDRAQFVDLLLARLTHWLSPARRAHLVTRFQLILMAVSDPTLAGTLAEQRQQFLLGTQAALKRVGIRQASKVAPRLVATFDGILLDHIHAGGTPLVSSAQRREMLERCLQED